MLFVVSRTSGCDNAPCQGATLRKIVNVESYNFRTPEEYNKKWGRNWLAEGSNHRIDERGNITRNNGLVNVWTIEINSLDELIRFCEKYDNIIIKKHHRNNPDYKEIEIYDDWRE